MIPLHWLVLGLAFTMIVLTALLSSVLTLLLARRHFERRVRPALEAEIDRRVHEGLEELGKVVGERVRQGVIDGVAALPSTEVVRGATRTAARTGADLLGQSLGKLLGPRGRREDSEP